MLMFEARVYDPAQYVRQLDDTIVFESDLKDKINEVAHQDHHDS